VGQCTWVALGDLTHALSSFTPGLPMSSFPRDGMTGAKAAAESKTLISSTDPNNFSRAILLCLLAVKVKIGRQIV
jgi:hypothetical protein